MGMFDFLNPAASANKYLSQIPGAVQPYYQPYMDAGSSVLPGLESQYGQLMQDPSQRLGEIGAGYTQSPGYQQALQQALGAGLSGSAAGGMLGTPASQQTQGDIAGQLSSQDYQNYMNNALGLYQSGLQGGMGLGQMGQQASTQYGNILGSNLVQQGGYAAAGTAGLDKLLGSAAGNIFGALGNIK